jgi:septum formation protein
MANRTTPLVLASTSSYRRALLARLGLPFTWVAPGVDEAAAKTTGQSPLALATQLARAKALAVARREPDAVVVGSDQVVAVEGTVLDKPGDRDRALAQLQRLRGRRHQLITAVAIAHPGGRREFHSEAVLHMRDLDDAALARYVDHDQPFDCAGSYKLEQLGIALFATVEAADHTAITGLPLLQLAQVLRELGFAVP